MADAGSAGGAYLASPTGVAVDLGKAVSLSPVYSFGLPSGVAVSSGLCFG
jgi:hypothetical protein